MQSWWECKLIQPLLITVWRFCKKLGANLPYDPVIPLLHIPWESSFQFSSVTQSCHIDHNSERHMYPIHCSTTYNTRIWKQPKCSSAGKWTRKSWYIYTMEYYSAIKKEWIFASWSELDKLRAYYTDRSKSEREKQILYINTYICNLKKIILMNLFTWQE